MKKFNRHATKPAAAKQSAPKRRFEGVRAATDREGMPPAGGFLFRCMGCEEGLNPVSHNASFKISVEVVDTDTDKAQAGETFKLIIMQNVIGDGQFKRFCMAIAGIEDEDEYDAFDPKGLFIEACLNHDNEFARDPDTNELIGNPCVGELFGCDVSLGKPDGKGDFYRNYKFFAVEEEEKGEQG